MGLKNILFKNVSAGIWSKSSMVLFRLIQVPLLISCLGVSEYGRWLVLYSLPSWLTMANLGFGNTATNEITIAVAAKDWNKAKATYSTALILLILIAIIGCLMALLIIPFIPWEKIIKLPENRYAEIKTAILWLSFTVFISFSSELFGGRLRAAKKYHVSTIINSTRPWIELLLMYIVLKFTKRLDFLSLCVFISLFIYLFIIKWVSRKALPQLKFRWKYIEIRKFSGLFKKGIAFQAFPLGNAIIFQGNLLVVEAILGPVAVALFATVRTLIRTVNQATDLIKDSFWPEVSYLFGTGDTAKIIKLHRFAVGLTLIISLLGITFLYFFGSSFYKLWLGNSITISQNLLFIFILSVPFNAIWNTSSVIHIACNKHEGLAKRYLFSCILSIIFCFLFSYYEGIEGAAISTLLADIVLIPYVLNKSLQLTSDNLKDFSKGLITEISSFILTSKKVFTYKFKF